MSKKKAKASRKRGGGKKATEAAERERIKSAVASGTVFAIYGSYPDIQSGLLNRGWVEMQTPVWADESEKRPHQNSGLKARRPKEPQQAQSPTPAPASDRSTGLTNAVPSFCVACQEAGK